MPNYDTETFAEIADSAKGDDWLPTSLFVRILGCTMHTANRHLLSIAREGELHVYDPQSGDGEEVPVEEIDASTGRLLGFRRPPDDPKRAPDYLETAFKRL